MCMYMERHPVFEALRHSSDACVGLTLRKASRAATQMYDQIMMPSGLTNVQFSLLSSLYYVGNISMKKLATRLVMDRTSLTRTLAPLVKRNLVQVVASENDRRRKEISLTADGLQALVNALPLWQVAQERMEASFGTDGLNQLRAQLRTAVKAAKGAGSQA